MIDYLWQIIWLFLPAGLANISASFFKWVPFLNYPVDMNKLYKGQPIFGSHKTWRGFFFGVLVSIAFVHFQQIIYPSISADSLVNYNRVNIILLGFLMGFGALLGDLARSFIKRRRGIAPGSPWFPWDQVDWIVGAIILSGFYIDISWSVSMIAIVLASLIHPAVNYTAYLCRLQSNKF